MTDATPQIKELPEGWAWATLAELSRYVTSGARHWSKYYANEGVMFIRTQDINTNELRLENVARMCIPESEKSQRTQVEIGDLLYTVTGANVGKCALVKVLGEEAYPSQSVALVKLRDKTLGAFLHLCSVSDVGQTQLEEMTYGVGRPVLNLDNIRDLRLPVAPSAEQRRIVAKVDALLARVNAARERLVRVPSILKRFRQSILAAACSGRLTEDWRVTNAPSSFGDVLFEQILAERKMGWRHALEAKSVAEGRTRIGPDWESRYPQPIAIDTCELESLPETWFWAPLDVAAAHYQYGPRFGEVEYVDDGVPTIRTTDMDWRGQINLSCPPKVRIEERHRDHFLLKEGDLLITRTGATIGKCALYHESLGPAIASAYLIRYRLTKATVLPQYLLLTLQSPWGQQYLLGGTTAVAQPNINTETLARMAIPVPPNNEQPRDRSSGRRIVQARRQDRRPSSGCNAARKS